MSLGSQWPHVALFALIVVAWAIVRPRLIRDEDGRRLPRNATARTFLVFFYLFFYLVLVGLIYHLGKGMGEAVSSVAGWFTELAMWIARINKADGSERITGHLEAPHLAFAIVSFLFTLRPLRDVETRFLIWAHGASNFSEDAAILSAHLASCGFVPSETELQRNIEWLRPFQLHVTDSTSRPVRDINLGSVVLWRKTSALLRLLREWNAAGQHNLNVRELQQLEMLQEAHVRKTRLGTQVIAFLASRGGEGDEATRVRQILEHATHGDPARTAETEGQVGAILAGAGVPQQPVELGSEQLEGYIRPINDYFIAEYQIIVEQAAKLAAKSVLLAADRAPGRLEELKGVGFQDLGHIEPFDINNILLTFLVVGLGGFLVFWAFVYLRGRLLMLDGVDAALVKAFSRHMLGFTAGIIIVMSVATLIGAMLGSRPGHVRGKAPWGTYLLGGMAAVVGFFAIHFAQIAYFGRETAALAELREQIDRIRERRALASQRAPAAVITPPPTIQRRPPMTLINLAPMAVLPFFIAVGICLLARPPQLVPVSVLQDHPVWRGTLERLVDGLAMAALLALASGLGLLISRMTGLGPPSRPLGTSGPPPWLLLMINFGSLGLVIGAAVLRDTRNAAHTQLVVVRDKRDRPSAVLAASPQPA